MPPLPALTGCLCPTCLQAVAAVQAGVRTAWPAYAIQVSTTFQCHCVAHSLLHALRLEEQMPMSAGDGASMFVTIRLNTAIGE